MTAEYPLYLWALAVSPVVLWLSLRRKGGMLISIIRLLAFVALVFALARFTLVHIHEESKATLLLDVSQSIDEKDGEMFLRRARSLTSQGISLSVVPFAETIAPRPVDLPSGSYAAFRESWARLGTGETNLDAALASPSARGIVLLGSDGYETKGSVQRSLSSIASLGATVYPLVSEEERERELSFKISNLSVPLIAPQQKSVEIRVAIKNSSPSRKTGALLLTHGGKRRLTESVNLGPGEEKVVIAESDESLDGLQEIVATLTPDSSRDPPSEARAFLASAPRERVLLLHGSREDARFLDEVFRRQSYQAESVVLDTGASPERDLSTYSAVVLNNVSVAQIAPRTLQRLKSYVENGGGLILSGGGRSFGLGGYRSTVLDDLSPLESLPPQTVKKRLNVGIALVMDKSRSMATDDRLESAKAAAREVIRTLKSEDYITVIGFDAAPFVVVKIGQLMNIRETALDRVGRLFPAGKTNLLPAIDEARRSLTMVPAGRKHMIILTDGRIPDEGPYYLSLVKDLRTLGITVSTILLGGDSEPGMLRTMAEIGGGQFYQSSDPRTLPRLFVKDVQVSTGEDTMKEREEYVIRAGTSPIVSTSLRSFPTIKGYVQTRAKQRARLELITYADQSSDPLLASWEVGKGTVVAFASDASGRWSAPWIRWDRYSTFWSDLVTTVRPKDSGESSAIKFDLRHEVTRRGLDLDLSLFSDVRGSQIRGEISGPDGKRHEAVFTPSARGRYTSRVEPVVPGAYKIQLFAGDSKLPLVGLSLSGELFGEQKGKGYHYSLLEDLASATGGVINPPRDALRQSSVAREDRRDLTPIFLGLALLCFLAEIVWRERVK